MTDKTLALGSLRIRATDGIILGALGFFSLLTMLFAGSVEGWWMLVGKNIGVAILYIVLVHFSLLASRKFPRFLLRVGAVTLAYAYLFGAVDKLQLVIHGEWLDAYVLDAEQYVFDLQPTLWLQHITTPALTEWLMFSYVIYIPMYPVLSGIIYYLRGELAMEDYIFALGLTNILCDLGFVLFPVAGPMPTIGHLYTVPLDGYVFTAIGEFIRSHLHYIGGSIPSPHAAAATVMWIMAYRYHRPSFLVITPIVLSLYVSTFYGRYHYFTDAVVGIAVALLALKLTPIVIKTWERLVERTQSATPPNTGRPAQGAVEAPPE
ncbi:MAG: hypothetical protein FJ217_13985 [Ignavibacteria bacterium]|nr:hypothetical protein [Ignavibacteria bacterium]